MERELYSEVDSVQGKVWWTEHCCEWDSKEEEKVWNIGWQLYLKKVKNSTHYIELNTLIMFLEGGKDYLKPFIC